MGLGGIDSLNNKMRNKSRETVPLQYTTSCNSQELIIMFNIKNIFFYSFIQQEKVYLILIHTWTKRQYIVVNAEDLY